MDCYVDEKMAREFLKWSKDKAFCNSGQHIVDRLSMEFEEQLSRSIRVSKEGIVDEYGGA